MRKRNCIKREAAAARPAIRSTLLHTPVRHGMSTVLIQQVAGSSSNLPAHFGP
jgi:hypothetical protein